MPSSKRITAGFAASLSLLLPPSAMLTQEGNTNQTIQIRVTVGPSRIDMHTQKVFKIDLVNTSAHNIWVYKGTWDCGGLAIEISDFKGKRLMPRRLWGLPPLPPKPDDFVSLKPGEALSATTPGDLLDLGVTKPGSYSAIVYYFHQVETVDGELRVRLSQYATKSKPIQFSVHQ